MDKVGMLAGKKKPHRMIFILAGIAAGLWLSACGAGNGGDPKNRVKLEAPEGAEEVTEAVSRGVPYIYSGHDFAFAAGMAASVLDCSPQEVPAIERIELGLMMQAGAFHASIPDMKNTPGNQVFSKMASTQAALTAGAAVGKSLECAEPDVSQLAKNLLAVDRSNRQGPEGSESAFMSSCTPRHGAETCLCAGMFSRASDPNIFQKQYSQQLMYGVMEYYPLTGFALLSCGLVNY